jgi:hypothetical protein
MILIRQTMKMPIEQNAEIIHNCDTQTLRRIVQRYMYTWPESTWPALTRPDIVQNDIKHVNPHWNLFFEIYLKFILLKFTLKISIFQLEIFNLKFILNH